MLTAAYLYINNVYCNIFNNDFWIKQMNLSIEAIDYMNNIIFFKMNIKL